MSNIDFSKVKVGDKLIAEITVKNISDTSTGKFFQGECITGSDYISSWFREQNITQHIPKPKEISIGTVFEYDGDTLEVLVTSNSQYMCGYLGSKSNYRNRIFYYSEIQGALTE